MNSDIEKLWHLLDKQNGINEKQNEINESVKSSLERIHIQLIDMMQRELEDATN